jgi:hypothetical protein
MTKSSFKESSSHFNQETPISHKPKKQEDHLIAINGGAHPNHMIVPSKGVTLITNGGAIKKSYSNNTYTTQKQVIGYQQTGNKRMSRAQYAATIAVGFSYLMDYTLNKSNLKRFSLERWTSI